MALLIQESTYCSKKLNFICTHFLIAVFLFSKLENTIHRCHWRKEKGENMGESQGDCY